MLRTLSTRLTFCFTCLFALLALLVFGLAYFSLEHNLFLQVDRELHEDTLEFKQIYQQQGMAALQQSLALESQSETPEQIFFRLFTTGQPALHSDLTTWSGLPPYPAATQTDDQSHFLTIRLDGPSGRIRLCSRRLDAHTLLELGYRMSAEDQLLHSFLGSFGIAFVIMLLCGGFIGAFLARHALAGIEQVRQSAERISRGDLSVRIPPDGGSEEIRNLSQSFNRMQERIQSLIGELGDVTNNVAHDLRSPLTRIRGLAETTLMTAEQNLEDYQEMAAVVIEESDRLVGMINTMLEIAETDAGVQPLAQEPVDMATLAEDVVELYSAVADDKQLRLAVDTGRGPLLVAGDRPRLQRALANLLDNAIKYTPKGGRVLLSAGAAQGQIVLRVTDSGPGIPTADLPHVCNRFFRGDQSRSTPGSGLGLSLVQAIARAHGGGVKVTSQLGQGTEVSLYLPAAP